MRKNIIKSVLGFVVMALVFSSCYEQEVSAPISPDGYPVFTITTDFTGSSIREGESITYTIELDKPIDHALDFGALILDGSVADDHDIEYSGSVEAYRKTGQIVVSMTDDMLAEGSEGLKFELGVYSVGQRYLLNESQVNPSYEYTIMPPNALTLNFGWDSDDDYDMVIFEDADDDGNLVPFSDAGATGANPELDASIKLTDTASFYINFMNWGAPDVDYSLLVEYPTGVLETVDGSFSPRQYLIDDWTAWGNYYYSYRALKVVNDGSAFEVTKLEELADADYTSVSGLDGIWSGYDGSYGADFDWRFNSHVNTYVDGVHMTIDSLNYEWMMFIWGEVFQEMVPVDIILYADGSVHIPGQYIGTTWYDADEDGEIGSSELYPYYIYGTGTYSGGVLSLEYELDQEGFLVADWLLANGYSDTPYFVAEVGLGSKASSGITATKEIIRPKNR